MKDKKETNNFNNEISEIEDSSKYGEFISSYFTWNTLAGQKEKVKDLENMTKGKNKEKKRNQE